MGMNCLKCNQDLSKFEDYDLIGEIIECTNENCKNKMIVEYEEFWEDGWDEEDYCWWLEPVKEKS